MKKERLYDNTNSLVDTVSIATARYYWSDYRRATKAFNIHERIDIRSDMMPDRERDKHDKHETERFRKIESGRCLKRVSYHEPAPFCECKIEKRIRQRGL